MSDAPRLTRADWARDPAGEAWRGRFEGAALGTGVSVIFVSLEGRGQGAVLHTHPYDEVFIIRRGRALFTLGEVQVEAVEGDVLCAPAGTPHKFVTVDDALYEGVDIHLSGRIIQTDLE